MSAPKALVRRIGNRLSSDTDYGVRARAALNAAYELSPDVALLDGGPQGIYLVRHVCDYEELVLLKGIDFGLSTGTMKPVESDEALRMQAGLLIDAIDPCVGYDLRVH